MDEPYLLAAARYIELNPVRARLALAAGQFRWSSAAAHLAGKDDPLVKVSPLLNLVGDWRALLNSGLTVEEMQLLRQHERTGRPLGAQPFLERVEEAVGRVLRRLKPGPKAGSRRN